MPTSSPASQFMPNTSSLSSPRAQRKTPKEIAWSATQYSYLVDGKQSSRPKKASKKLATKMLACKLHLWRLRSCGCKHTTMAVDAERQSRGRRRSRKRIASPGCTFCLVLKSASFTVLCKSDMYMSLLSLISRSTWSGQTVRASFMSRLISPSEILYTLLFLPTISGCLACIVYLFWLYINL